MNCAIFRLALACLLALGGIVTALVLLVLGEWNQALGAFVVMVWVGALVAPNQSDRVALIEFMKARREQ